MTLIALKTGGRAQRSAVFSISLKTGEGIELTISGGNPACCPALSPGLKTPSGPTSSKRRPDGGLSSSAWQTHSTRMANAIGASRHSVYPETHGKPSANPIETHGVSSPSFRMTCGQSKDTNS